MVVSVISSRSFHNRTSSQSSCARDGQCHKPGDVLFYGTGTDSCNPTAQLLALIAQPNQL